MSGEAERSVARTDGVHDPNGRARWSIRIAGAAKLNAQHWYRDPLSTGGVGLTNATEFELAP